VSLILVMSTRFAVNLPDFLLRRWGNKFVVVGTQKLRESVLIPNTVSEMLELNTLQYCVLERIGRSRYNGELTHSLGDMQPAFSMFYTR